MPLAQLRELAGVCLSFSMDMPSVARASSGRPEAGVYAGGRRGAEDANNRRVLMLEALPAVLGACCAVAAAEEEDDDVGTDDGDDEHSDHSSESDSDQGEEEAGGPMVGRGRGGREGHAPVATAAAAAAGKKGKGKGKSGGNNDGRRWSGGIRTGARHNRRSKVADTSGGGGGGGGGGSWSWGGLPKRGEAIVRDVTDALLDRPWPRRLVLPLLVVFEEIYGLVEVLDCRARQPATESAGGGTAGNESVWARVRSRLMETVWMGGLDGADFTGVVRQVWFDDIGTSWCSCPPRKIVFCGTVFSLPAESVLICGGLQRREQHCFLVVMVLYDRGTSIESALALPQ